uniref:Uncharacterized protein n=1 Tax=Babesia bovis TaxID=5865 RepID=S6B573_BABBO|nr:hypothetical protein [Babesia bovis]
MAILYTYDTICIMDWAQMLYNSLLVNRSRALHHQFCCKIVVSGCSMEESPYYPKS